MRLVGVALVVGWLAAFSVSPHGEPLPPTSVVGAVAIAGTDRAALAWLELSHGSPDRGGRLHVAAVDEHDVVRPLFDQPAREDATAYRLLDAGDGRFVLASEYRSDFHAPGPSLPLYEQRIVFERFDVKAPAARQTVTLAGTPGSVAYEYVAGGDQLLVAEEAGAATLVYSLDDRGEWLPPRSVNGRVLLGSANGHVVRYEVGWHEDTVVVDPAAAGAFTMQVSKPADPCTGRDECEQGRLVREINPCPHCERDVNPNNVVSVVPLRGGYARLARSHTTGVVDGMRDGQPFAYPPVDLSRFAHARLSVDGDGALAIYDETHEARVGTYRALLAKDGSSPATLQYLAFEGLSSDAHRQERERARLGMLRAGTATMGATPEAGTRYRLFGHGGAAGVPTIATELTTAGTEVVFERYHGVDAGSRPPSTTAGPSATLFHRERASASTPLAPVTSYAPDLRPLLRKLAAVPLGVLLLSLIAPLALRRRLAAITPLSPTAPLAAGRVVVEGRLAREADAPEGGLRLRRAGPAGDGAGAPLRLFVEGAEVLRASDMRRRDEPRGDAVDIAAGASIVAVGTGAPGDAFRGEDTVHARRGDLVLVGCTLAEARARVAAHLRSSITLAAGCALAMALVALG